MPDTHSRIHETAHYLPHPPLQIAEAPLFPETPSKLSMAHNRDSPDTTTIGCTRAKVPGTPSMGPWWRFRHRQSVRIPTVEETSNVPPTSARGQPFVPKAEVWRTQGYPLPSPCSTSHCCKVRGRIARGRARWIPLPTPALSQQQRWHH